MADLSKSAKTVVRRCLAVKEGEEVLVITDPARLSIGEALRDEAASVGADAVIAVMDERAMDGNEPPRSVAGALLGCDVFIAPTTRSLSHTTARKRATDAGARGATMPRVTEDMLARVMAVDFELMGSRSRAVAALLDEGNTARVTCPRGSDLTLELNGRRAIGEDGVLTARGAFGNLPCGEGFIAPLSGDGQVVAATLGPLGVSDTPATLTVKGGRLASAEGGL